MRNEVVGTDRVINIMMFDIDEDVAEKFYSERYEDREEDEKKEKEGMTRIQRISGEMTREAGIQQLVPGATIDPRGERLFFVGGT